MIEVCATHILSPLGTDTAQNYRAVKAGRSALARCEERIGVPELVTASMFSDEQWKDIQVADYTPFESLIIRSVAAAVKETDIDLASDKTVFILATTKGDITEAEKGGTYTPPGQTALRVARYFGITTQPIVVCNACISGASAQFLAKRLLENGCYDNAIVCGADTVSRFTTAGFLSFKALSPYECRPFDMERLGLNLGEAAATIIFGRATDARAAESPARKSPDTWKLCRAAQTNDAYHVSAPIPSGEGQWQAINRISGGAAFDKISCINAHGTATMFNDQAESKAIQHAGLEKIPVQSLKGYYGHTLGAAGVLEAVITMEALNDGLILANRGFSEIGVSGKINIGAEAVDCPNTRSFLKIMSGFGGCNAALLYSKDSCEDGEEARTSVSVQTLRSVHIDNRDSLTALYKEHINDYPKFYKMDGLSKLLFVATHLLLEGIPADCKSAAPQSAALPVILFNVTSSIAQDKKHIETYADPQGFYPSPSVFLYTLPNIAIGEIAIRHHLTAETTLYILPEEDPAIMNEIVAASYPQGEPVITGYVDYRSENDFKADLKLVTCK